MSAIMKKIICNPAFPMIAAAITYTLLTCTSAICLYFYFTKFVNNEFWHWHLISYLIMLANGLSGYSEFFAEESFCPLRDLLDQCQVALVLPCYAAEMWMKTEMGPPEIAAIHAGLGILAVLMFVMCEERRQDLIDLAIFANGFSLLAISVISGNIFTFLATCILVTGYCIYKRQEDQCCLAPLDKFNIVMALFAAVSLLSFNDDLVKKVQDTVKKAIGRGGAAAPAGEAGEAEAEE